MNTMKNSSCEINRWPLLSELTHDDLSTYDEDRWVSIFEAWNALSHDEEKWTWLNHLGTYASELRDRIYGRQVFIRGLIEYSNFCQNDCLYCGIRRSNKELKRYRLTEEQVKQACKTAYDLGIRTFVMQGGENAHDDKVVPELVRWMRTSYPDVAITLSLGEKSPEVYRAFKEAGANRYLLRHETAHPEHYKQLHPAEMDGEKRKACLKTLKSLGFQTGCGFMVGTIGQTPYTLAQDFMWMRDLQPQMVGIGPFVPQQNTPFKDHARGDVLTCLFCLSLTRLLLPTVLLPATTALATLAEDGHLLGMAQGANVVMPNMTPWAERQLYTLYDGKKSFGTEAAEGYHKLCSKLRSAGYEVNVERGDFAGMIV